MRRGLISSVALIAVSQAATYPRACQEPEVVQDFDLEAYLGLWYEIVRDKDTNYEHGICNTANYSIRADGNIRVLNNEWYPDQNVWGGGEGYAFQVDPSADDGYLKVKFVPTIPAGDYKIIATDYDNYAVIYSCFSLGKLASREYVWVLGRSTEINEANRSDIISAIQE